MKNPHDGDFKDLAEDHPELLLRLLGILQPGTKTQITNILRELRLEPLAIDHAYLMENETGKWVAHLEAVSKWNLKQTGSMALYQFLLKRQEKLPVVSHVIFMAEKYAPRATPECLVYEDEDGLRIEAPYNVIRLWEIDPALAFEPGCEPLLAWVPLLKGGLAEFERATEAIARLPEPDVLRSKLVSLAALRYDKDTIKGFLGRLEKQIMLASDALKVSWLYQEGWEEGKAEGEVTGRAEGKAEGEAAGIAKGKFESIRIALTTKFPGLDVGRELSQIRSHEILDDLLAAILRSHSAEEVRSVILTAANSQQNAGLQ